MIEQMVNMFAKGAGVGAWVAGCALTLVVAIPVIALLCAIIGMILRIGKKDDTP